MYPQRWNHLLSEGGKEQAPQLDWDITVTPEVCVLEGLLSHMGVE